MNHRVPILAALLALAAGLTHAGAAAPAVPWALVAVRPHDPGAYTQGLVAHDGVLLESTGDCCPQGGDRSSVRRVDPRTGRVLAITREPSPVFGEGLTVLGGTAWQLTWRNGRAFRYSPGSLARLGEVRHRREGWGLTTSRGRLVASDGTATLRWLRPPDLAVTRRVVVRDGDRPVTRLNELERIGSLIWANVLSEDSIVLIDPATGAVRGRLDLSSLRTRLGRPGEVLNGIARDPVTGHVVVTGKNWDRMFVIRVIGPAPGRPTARSLSR